VTAKLQPAEPALLTPTQASQLLEQVMFEHIFECVNLDAIYRLEHSMIMMLCELEGIGEPQAIEAVRAMIDRALLRLPGATRDYLNAASWPLPGCELCEEEAEANAEDDPGPSGKRRRARATHASVRLDS